METLEIVESVEEKGFFERIDVVRVHLVERLAKKLRYGVEHLKRIKGKGSFQKLLIKDIQAELFQYRDRSLILDEMEKGSVTEGKFQQLKKLEALFEKKDE